MAGNGTPGKFREQLHVYLSQRAYTSQQDTLFSFKKFLFGIIFRQIFLKSHSFYFTGQAKFSLPDWSRAREQQMSRVCLSSRAASLCT